MKELLTGILPTSFNVGGKQYEISSDFRVMLELDEIFSLESISDDEKGERALRLFYGCIPSDINEAVDRLIYFWKCGRKDKRMKRRGSDGAEQSSQRPVFSFTHDAGLIYAAFMTQYGIDLTDVEYLHWWKFMAMFESLEDDRLIKEVMRCRAVEVKGDMPQAQKEYYNAMKKRYELPLPEGAEQYLDALEAALMGDGNVDEVIKCMKQK